MIEIVILACMVNTAHPNGDLEKCAFNFEQHPAVQEMTVEECNSSLPEFVIAWDDENEPKGWTSLYAACRQIDMNVNTTPIQFK